MLVSEMTVTVRELQEGMTEEMGLEAFPKTASDTST